jgi:hypothetical protein
MSWILLMVGGIRIQLCRTQKIMMRRIYTTLKSRDEGIETMLLEISFPDPIHKCYPILLFHMSLNVWS